MVCVVGKRIVVVNIGFLSRSGFYAIGVMVLVGFFYDCVFFLR